jgi:hypothetical protein
MPLTDEERRAMLTAFEVKFENYLATDDGVRVVDYTLPVASIVDWAASEVERERASIVEWLRGAEARMKQQREAGAVSLHHMHVAGQLDACAAIANAIEKGEHR